MKIESCRLETSKRLENFISFLAPIACRLLSINYFHRIKPDAPSSLVLTPIEIKYLSFKSGKHKEEELTIKEAIHLIAKLGGFLGRKRDKDPGILSLLRGWIIFNHKIETINEFEGFF